MRSRAWLCALSTVLLPSAALAGKENVYAIVGARVVTVSGPVHETATVILRDGVIEAVGPAVTPPADARIIEGKGLTLTPGLIDAFGGVGLPVAAPRPAGQGGAPAGGGGAVAATNPLAPQAMALDRVRPADALKARDAGVTTALVIGKDGVLPGQSVLLNLSGEKAEGMALKQPAAMHLHMATIPRQYPTAIMGTMAYARQALYDAGHYRDEWTAYDKAPLGKKRPKYDAALAAWQDVLAGKETLIVTATRENDIRRTVALADEFRIKVAVAGAPQASRLSGLIKEKKLPLLVTVNFDPPRPAAFGFGGGGADEDKERKDIEEAEKNPAELQKAGVTFALVSGHAPNFVAGIKKAIEKGLPADAALKAVTLRAAEALGVADRTGSLEAGKIANVVAWSGEPLSKDAKVKLVFVDGQLYEPSTEEAPPGPGRHPTPGVEQSAEQHGHLRFPPPTWGGIGWGVDE